MNQKELDLQLKSLKPFFKKYNLPETIEMIEEINEAYYKSARKLVEYRINKRSKNAKSN